MKLLNLCIIAVVGVLACGQVRAEDASWSDAYAQWKEAADKAQERANASGDRSGSYAQRAVQDTLNQALASRYEIEHLADSLKSRAEDIDTAKFHAKMAKDELDSAKEKADQLSQQEDEKAQKLKDESDRIATEDKRLDGIKEDLNNQSNDLSARIQRHNDAPHTFQLPDQQAASDAYEAEKNSLDAEKSQLDQKYKDLNDQIDKRNDWAHQLKEIEDLITEDGKAVLEARGVESKKEEAYTDAQGKVDKLQSAQDEEISKLAALMGPSLAALQATLTTTFDGAAPRAFDLAPAHYAGRVSDDQATAVGLASAGDQGATGRLASRIYVMPSSQPPDNTDSQTELMQRRLSAEMALDKIATQYKLTTATSSQAAPAPTDSTSLVRAPAGFIGPADDNGGDSVVFVDNTHPSAPVDPGQWISKEEYDSALRQKQRLETLIPKLRAELLKLESQRGKLEGYDAEFEELRAESIRGAIRDALGVIPVTSILERLSTDARLASTLTPENIHRVELAMNLVKMEVTREHSQQTHDPAEQRAQRTEVIETGAETLLSICTHELPGDGSSRLMLEQMGKMLKVYGKFDKYLQDPKAGEGSAAEQAGDLTKLGIGVAGVFYAPVALGAGIESLGEKGLQAHIAQGAMDNLSASLRANQDAEMFLTMKIDQSQRTLNEVNRTVELGSPRRSAPQIQAQTP